MRVLSRCRCHRATSARAIAFAHANNLSGAEPDTIDQNYAEFKLQAGEQELGRANAAAQVTCVTYTGKGPLGIGFIWPRIESLEPTGLVARFPGGQRPPYGQDIRPGMELIAVNGTSVIGVTVQQGNDVCEKAGRPITLEFRLPVVAAAPVGETGDTDEEDQSTADVHGF